jgi:subtilase family serine protease
MQRVRRRSAAALIAAAFVLAIVALPTIGSAAQRTRLRGSSAPIAKPSQLVRTAAAGETVNFELYLGLRDERGAESALAAVSNPRSASYGRYLSPSAFRARFARPASDVAAARAWLRSQDFAVGAVLANHTTVAATGTVAQVDRAFQTTLNYYRAGGRELRAPATAPSIPSTLNGVVRGVLDLADVTMRSGVAPPEPAARTAHPCSDYWGQLVAKDFPRAYHRVRPFTICGYTPQQIRGAYGLGRTVKRGTDGSGTTVAVVDAFASPTLQRDITRYSKRHGLPPITLHQTVASSPFDQNLCGEQGWYGEQTLDVDAVHGVAPGAGILYWGAASCLDRSLRDAETDIVENHRADIITNSFGGRDEQDPASHVEAWHDIFLQAGLEGIGTYFSSGDAGDGIADVGYRTVELPASDPATTAVGGTSLGVDALNHYTFETGWGTGVTSLVDDAWVPKPPGDFLYGGGGGTSRIFAEPAYQRGVVPRHLAGYWGGSNRVVPDVAMDGDPSTAIAIGQTMTFPNGDVRYVERRLGGTSLSSPMFAGVMAIADDAAGFAHGFVNPALYRLAGSSAFHDVTDPPTRIASVRADYVNGVNRDAGLRYGLRTLNFTGTLHTRRGYDDVTGVGTPRGRAFLQALAR